MSVAAGVAGRLLLLGVHPLPFSRAVLPPQARCPSAPVSPEEPSPQHADTLAAATLNRRKPSPPPRGPAAAAPPAAWILVPSPHTHCPRPSGLCQRRPLLVLVCPASSVRSAAASGPRGSPPPATPFAGSSPSAPEKVSGGLPSGQTPSLSGGFSPRT